MSENKALLIFVKNAVEGKVKTRLAKNIGNKKALEAYLLLSYYTKDVSKKIKAKKYVYYSDGIEDIDLWPSKGFHKMAQFGKDLGERMLSAFQFSLNSHEKVVLIGSDCPLIKKVHLKLAYEALNKHEVVIGPAKDGGYYLIGMSKMHASLFEDIDWSTDNVLPQTIAKLEKSEVKYKLLEELEDVDTITEWDKYKVKLEHSYLHLLDTEKKDPVVDKLSDDQMTHNDNIIFEDKFAQLILSKDPITKGHALIIPREEFLDIDEIPSKVLHKIMILAKKYVTILKTHFDAPGYSIMQNGGAFNDIGKFQLHVFPRYNDKDFSWTYNKDIDAEAADFKKLATLLREDYLDLIHANRKSKTN
jgi:rSAM/selenodomain-associated transferase 1